MKCKFIIISSTIFLISPSIIFAQTPNQTCVETSRTCTQGAETRIISGTAIHKDCWNYNINYQCYTAGNYNDNCAGVKQISGCSQLSSVCQSNSSDGGCSKYYNKYVCASPVDNPSSLHLTLVDQDQHIISEILNDSACSNYANNSDCKVSQDSVCTSGAQTRVINNMSIARDCWTYQKQYTCKAGFVNGCEQYEDDCNLQNQNCLTRDSSGLCTYTSNVYQCPTPTTQTNISCGSQNYITYNKDQNFGKAAANLAILQEAGKELNKDNLTTFSGNGYKCGKDNVNFSNCCQMGGWNNDASYVTSYGGAMKTPTSAIIDALASCSTQEKALSAIRPNRLCVYVGSYCSKEEPISGLCLATKESYCCFNSRLSRLINEQGRPQIGKGWGSPEAPDCSGITISDLQRIDFEKIDKRQLYDDLLAMTKIPDRKATGDKVASTIQNYYKDSQQ